MKKVSVTIAIIYHKNVPQKYFNLSLNSALAQIGLDFKIHVYTEGLNVINADEKVSVSSVPEKLFGKPAAIRQYIVETTDTEYLAFWDSDDVYTIDRLYEQMKLINRESLDYCYANFSFFDDRSIFPDSFFAMIGFHQREVNIFDENYVGLGIVTAKSDKLRRLLPFPEITTLDWWIAIKSKMLGLNSGYLDKVHGYYRLHGDSYSNLIKEIKDKDVIREWENKVKLYENLRDEHDEIRKRYLFFKELDVIKNMKNIIEAYKNKKYKNIWGGIIPYEKN